MPLVLCPQSQPFLCTLTWLTAAGISPPEGSFLSSKACSSTAVNRLGKPKDSWPYWVALLQGRANTWAPLRCEWVLHFPQHSLVDWVLAAHTLHWISFLLCPTLSLPLSAFRDHLPNKLFRNKSLFQDLSLRKPKICTVSYGRAQWDMLGVNLCLSLCPPKYVEVLIHSTSECNCLEVWSLSSSECDLIWK